MIKNDGMDTSSMDNYVKQYADVVTFLLTQNNLVHKRGLLLPLFLFIFMLFSLGLSILGSNRYQYSWD